MRAVNAVSRTGVNVKLAVDHNPIAFVRGDRLSLDRVVVDLERLACGHPDVEHFMVAPLSRIVEQGPVEGDLGAAGAALEIVVQALVVRRIPATARNEQDERCGDRN